MSKWTRTRRDPGRSYTDEEKLERKQRMLARLNEFVEAGIEAEPLCEGGEGGKTEKSQRTI